MSVVDIEMVRARRDEERVDALLDGVGEKALRDAERAFAVGNTLLRVDHDMAIDVYRGTRRRLLVWVRGSLQAEAAPVRARAYDYAALLYQARLFDLIDERHGCRNPRTT